ncbi:MAG: tetratricopeptide repeat protein, partial [Acidithiobacillus sp.]|uniref:O-linked N-acetylglucosamine transferase, SPINDLY family protein n=1 Tax=Acidithiobacillus sp. TaxID=1872118 RepID=UPI003D009408
MSQNTQVPIPQALQYAIACHRQGKLQEAENIYTQILAQQPDHADALHLLGALRFQQGQPEPALELVEKAMARHPDQSFYHNTRGRILLALGRGPEGVADLERAVALEPQNAEAYFNLAETLLQRGRVAEAEAGYRRALTLRPIFAQAAAGLGNALRLQGDLGGALPYLQLAASLEPQSYPYALNLALVFHMLGHLDLAIDRYQKILEQHPQQVDARMNLASCFALIGDKQRSIAEFVKAREVAPQHPVILDGLYEAKRQACDWEDLPTLEADCVRAVRAGIAAGVNTGFRGFTVLYLPLTAAEIRENNRLLCAQIGAGLGGQLWRERLPKERLRIGYLTADVKEHPTAHLILDLFSLHDTDRFEIFLYSWAADDKSNFRHRIKQSVEHFVECYRLPDKDIAERIAADEVDVLIDLMGHTSDNRLGILARRPAPVQLGYLGYPGTYGGLVDYLIADPVVLPQEHEAEESVERVARLPHCYQINSHRQVTLGVTPPRDLLGLPAEGMILCCMNNSFKLDPFVFQIWCRVLEQLPGSVLWLLQGPPAMVANLQKAAKENGIDVRRLIFAPRVSREQHLTRLQAADLFLDTRFYNAHTTATDALWAGVPVLTVRGHSFSARVAESLLRAVGLPEMVMPDWLAYEAEILRLAQQPDRLRTLREKLIANRTAAPLFDTPRLVRDLESIYRHAWDRFQAGEEP